MVSPARLIGVVERMDQPEVGVEDLRRALIDLARVNRLFGGTRAVLGPLRPWLARLRPPIRLLDVATGFADLPRAIADWARHTGTRLSVEALDHHPAICALAREACRDYPEITIRQGDALALPYPDQGCDLAMASQVLHHLEGAQPIRLLQELRRVARHGVLVSDLRRGTWPYLVTAATLPLVSASPLIRHDGPLSIRRGFLPTELVGLARAAGWPSPQVRRSAFFRLVVMDAMDSTGRGA